MGVIYAEIQLFNSGDLDAVERNFIPPEQVRQVKVSALVDTGSLMLAIPRSIAQHLGVRKLDSEEVELADGSIVALDVAGPIEVRFQNRRTTVEAVVFEQETEVLLGAIPMEAMDVLIDPRQQLLTVNPKHPGRARVLMKSSTLSKLFKGVMCCAQEIIPNSSR